MRGLGTIAVGALAIAFVAGMWAAGLQWSSDTRFVRVEVEQ